MSKSIENIAFRVTPSIAAKLQAIATERGVSQHLVARALMLQMLANETGDLSVLDQLANPQRESFQEIVGLLRKLLSGTRTINSNLLVTAIALLTDAGRAELVEAQQFANEHLEQL